MDHYGMLRDYRFSDDVDDIRGASLYGADDDKLGKIDDVIFDHATGTIQYAVVDTGGWLSSKKFLVPADRIHPDAKNKDDFAIDATKQQIEALAEVRRKCGKHGYSLDRLRQALPHRVGTRAAAAKGRQHAHHYARTRASCRRARAPAWTTRPTCRTGLRENFPRPVRIPASCACAPPGLAARAEDSRLPGTFEPQEKPTLAAEENADRATGNPVQAQRDHLTDPDEVYVSERERHARWTAFEDHLRRNRVDITGSCRSCGTVKDKVA